MTMQVRHSVMAFVGCALLLGFTCAARAAEILPEADFCEFPTAKDAQAFGWETEATNGKPIIEAVADHKVGRYAVKARGKDFMGDWGTLVLLKDLDLSGAQKGDKIVFFIKQNIASGIYLNVEGTYVSFPVTAGGEWTRMELDMDPAKWTWPGGLEKWGRKKRFAFYAHEFTSAGQYLIVDGLSFQIGGKQLPANIPPSHEAKPDDTAIAASPAAQPAPAAAATLPPPKPVSDAWARAAATKPLPQEDEQAWLLGNADAFWAVSKQNGSIIGGWNGPKRERCLQAVEGAYYLEDKKDLIKASENGDVVTDRRLSADTQELRVTCTNRALKNVQILKTYSVRGGTLTREIRFTSGLGAPFFISYRSEAKLEPGFRQGGSYVGAGSFGPIEAAASIPDEKQPMYYVNSRGMILSNPVRGYSLAHYRLKQDGKFVLPWWTFSRSESAKDCFYYTSTGWKMPFGISKLDAGGITSYEENLTISPGNYYDFVTRDYGAREDVRKDLDGLGPVPAWLSDVVVMRFDGGSSGRDYTDFNNIKRIAELTDEGTIMVEVGGMGPNWANYYMDEGLVGLHGGQISGPELREWIQKIKAISPRIKVGIYCYMDAVNDNGRLFKEHPEWFRGTDKEGNRVNHFSGTSSRTTMFNIPECRQAVLAQFDGIFTYLGADFVYLDDALTNNLVNWETGQVLTDRDCYDLFRGIREVARRHGPDKAVFFNGQGDPYGDINFIEAYTRIAADVWRQFAGVGLGVETFLINRPDARVTPLYWTQQLNREYVNRVLALGWIPALEYTQDVASRPFVTAAYEIGNVNPINAEYQPDWRKQKDLKIESYSVRRLGDNPAIFSFISYEDNPARQRIAIKTDSLGLDPNKPLSAWLYRVKDANTYSGLTSEKLAKSIYGETGWTLDLVAAPECVYAGAAQAELALDVELAPRMLTMLVVGNDAGAVYSTDGLPRTFLFSKVRGVNLTSRVNTAGKEVILDVESDRDRCEVVGFVAPDWSVKEVSLDGKAVSPSWIMLGDSITPLISVGRGKHSIRIACDGRAAPRLKLDAIKTALTGKAIEITLPAAAEGATKALVMVRQEGQVLFNRMVEKQQGLFRVPLTPQRGGTCEIAVKAAQLPTGAVKVDCAPAKLSLPNNPPVLALVPANPGYIPEQKEIREINKNIRGLDVLRTASQTTATSITPFQTDLKGLTVEVSPDTLTIDAGTTRKIEGYLGAAFGGFEIKDLRTVRIRLKNTYFGALHMNGPNIHTHLYYLTTRLFAGFMVDYHTAAGYSKRVALSVGAVHPDCSTPFPSYGKGSKPDQLVDLGPIILQGAEKEFDLDLSQYAPEGWDGQVWFSVGSDWALPGRRLNAQILSANQTPAGTALRGTDPTAIKKAFLATKRELTVPRAAAAPVIDGTLDDAAWKNAARAEDFFIVGGLSRPTAKTTAYLLYDDENLYIAFECGETQRKKPIFGKGDLWRDDEVEIYLDTENARKGYKQMLINAGGSKMELVKPGGDYNIGAQIKTSFEEGKRWIMEAAIPFKGLGKTPSPGDTWALNLCRFRPEGSGFGLEFITWAPTEQGFGGDEMARFGTMTFK